MSDEILDIVDEFDNVIGQKHRSEVHRSGYRHRAVHVFILNDLGQVFLQKRSFSKDINPGLWDTSVAGHVDFGESYEQCAVRELEEELGIRSLKTPTYVLKIPACKETGMEFIKVFRLNQNGPFILNKDEIDEGRWVNIDEMNIWVSSDSDILTESIKFIWRTSQRHGNLLES